MKKVALFIFTDGKKILVEQRALKGFQDLQYLIPGGGVLEKENLEDTLQREMMEELNVYPINFCKLPTKEKILGLGDRLLVPFLINKWKGSLPNTILDKGTPLVWIEIDTLINYSFEPTRKVIQALKNYLLKI